MKKTTSAIFLSFFLACVHGQPGVDFKGIPGKFISFCREIPREEIYVHTDREKYIAGENMWFSVYLADRATQKLSNHSSLAYIELLNYDNRPVVRKRIKLNNGVGQGHIILPDTVSSGIYTIRGYTNWMKNFLPSNCFKMKVNIYNAISSQTFMRKPLADIPESESPLLQGDPGFRFYVDNLQSGVLNISMNTDNSFRSRNSSIFIFIRTNGKINYTELVPLAGENIVRAIPKRLLSPGVNHITIFDAAGKPLSERFIYTSADRGQMPVVSSEESFGPREKIIAGVRLPEMKDTVPGYCSVSVAPVDANSEFIDLEDYMVFGSEFGQGIIERLRGKKIHEMQQAEIDSMLLGLRSSWINWNNVLSGKNTLTFQPETDYHFLPGRVVSGNFPGKMVIMSVPGKTAVFRYARTDENGNFSFSLPVSDRTMDMIIQPEAAADKSVVKISSSFSEDYPPAGHVADIQEISSDYEKLSVNYQVQKIYGSLLPAAKLSVEDQPWESRFYGKPDVGLVLDDYIQLPVMEEIFFEIIPGANLKKRRNGYDITIADPVSNEIYENLPSLFVDGVRVDDASVIANLDPVYVERIDVVKERYLIGDYLFHGIVNVITKAGDFSSVNLPEAAVRTTYRVSDPVAFFTSPEYTSPGQKQSRVPDFRNTLFWDPSVKLVPGGNNSMVFWSSDITGEYEISIQGVTPDGNFMSSRKRIKCPLQAGP